jgi:hypothetical protein
MSVPIFLPLRFLGWTALGFGLAVGWKLGSHLVSVAMGEKEFNWPVSPRDAPAPDPKTESS